MPIMPRRNIVYKPPDKAHCECHYKCRSLSGNDIKKLYSEFAELPHGSQGSYIMSRINITNIARRRNGKYEEPSSSKRQVSATYNVPSSEGNIQVCNNTFRAIFGISKKRNEKLLNRVKMGEIIFKDGRGKNPASRRIKYTEHDIQKIKNHILSFPREESHYSRHKTLKEYLSPDMNIHRLYIAFKKKYPDTHVDGKYYRRVFKKEFPKLSFKRPRTDTCRVCDKFKTGIRASSGTEMFSLISKRDIHHRKAEKALKLLSSSMLESQYPASSVTTIAIDMQQVLFMPTLTHSNMFYSRQLSNYNLCIHVGDTAKSFMCMWHEGVAGRGGNAVASCLFKVLTSGFTQKKHLEIWCDNCAGQNKNCMVLMVIIFLVGKGYYDSIDLKFLVSGHSYMPCDRDFGVIEKRKKVCSCMVPEEVQEMVQTAKLENAFNVVTMKKEDFLDVTSASDIYLNTTSLQISNKSWIQVSSSELPFIKARTTFNEIEEWDMKNIFKRRKFNAFKFMEEFEVDTKIPTINEEKKKDLLQMLQFLDKKYHQFYEDICK